MIGKRLSPILVEIEHVIIEHEAYNNVKPEYTDEAFRAGIKIFMSVMIDKSYELMERENISLEDSCNMSEAIGQDIRKLIKQYTDIDTHDLYKINP